MAARFNKPGQPFEGVAKMTKRGARWTGRVIPQPHKLAEPLHWGAPRRVFVNSMSDLFHEDVPYDFIRDVFGVMAMAKRHQFQVLTKRGKNMEQWFKSTAAVAAREYSRSCGMEWPLPNVWLGVSVEDQDAADERVPSLIAVPAAVKFISAEPLIGHLDLTVVTCPIYHSGGQGEPGECPICEDPYHSTRCANGYLNALEEGVDWVIVGCETGPRSQVRKMEMRWVRELRDKCELHDIPFFFKQSKDEKGKTVSLPVLDGRQHTEWPR